MMAYIINNPDSKFLTDLPCAQLRCRLVFLKNGVRDGQFVTDFEDRLSAAKELHRQISQEVDPSPAAWTSSDIRQAKMIGILWMAIVIGNSMISRPVYQDTFVSIIDSLLLSLRKIDDEASHD